MVLTSHTAVRLATIGRAKSWSGWSQSVLTWASTKMAANRIGVATAASISRTGTRALAHMTSSVSRSTASTPHDGVATARPT